ncbi:type 2 phosphatidylinositol 4,5-bisphosphate 4-phosphatase [Nilaparvata lugens]|uniref:type 2 phosphatidylinositol 4,5-bisphosphate 4-phosphatase n=1 Tax=Nilaparvata lugens TaxID=108931 RepID=UPI00193CE678|nr:type 2 phosphatidylinositol 4,5-bisphosphate 4-phosphatase [Nilaparvata lugens]
MGDDKEEKKPLLSQETRSYAPREGGVATVSPVGPDELPPPYQAATAGAGPKVTCRVCQELIDVTSKKDQHVVKCNRCNEATPIKNAPPGKKYVRCPCNCLLICKSTSQRIACPRPDCKQIINLAPSPVTPPVPSLPGMCRVSCVHCHDTFLFNTLQNALARCPHCQKVSSVGPDFSRGRGIAFLLVAIVFLLIGAGVTMLTYRYAAQKGGTYFVYIGELHTSSLFIISSLTILMSSVGPDFSRGRGIAFLLVAIVFLLIGAGVTMLTYRYAAQKGGTYFVYIDD